MIFMIIIQYSRNIVCTIMPIHDFSLLLRTGYNPAGINRFQAILETELFT